MKFRVIEAEKASVPIARGCVALGVSGSGFHAWQRRRPSAHQL
jgi:putative transposase